MPTLTFDQSTSSSSASTSARVVKVPWPISAAGDTMVVAPSGAIVTQAVSEVGALGPSASASSTNVSASGATVSASVSPAAEVRNRRRSTEVMPWCLVMIQPFRAARWIALMILR
jgi:hypothetical protein